MLNYTYPIYIKTKDNFKLQIILERIEEYTKFTILVGTYTIQIQIPFTAVSTYVYSEN